MPTLQNVSMSLGASGSVVATDDFGVTHPLPMALGSRVELANGTAVQQANLQEIWSEVLTTGAFIDIDLIGAVQNILGEDLDFVKVKGIIIANVSHLQDTPTDSKATASGTFIDLLLGGTSVTLPLQKKGAFALHIPEDGVTIVAGTSDVVRITETGSLTGQYKMWIVGTNA